MTETNKILEFSGRHVNDEGDMAGFLIDALLDGLGLPRRGLLGACGLGVEALLELNERVKRNLLG
jgi:hypothetical protein